MMQKLTAWLVTLLGILLFLSLLVPTATFLGGTIRVTDRLWFDYVIALVVIVAGIGGIISGNKKRR